MFCAARYGHIEIVKLMKKWGAKDFDSAMWGAAGDGQIDIVKMMKEWGAKDFDSAICVADQFGQVEIVKLLRGWSGWEGIHDELFRYHHKRKFYKKLYYDDLLPVAWHPDRFFDWCLDEDEKRGLEQMWPSTFSPKTNIFIEYK